DLEEQRNRAAVIDRLAGEVKVINRNQPARIHMRERTEQALCTVHGSGLTLTLEAAARRPLEIGQREAAAQILQQHVDALGFLRVDPDQRIVRTDQERELIELLDGQRRTRHTARKRRAWRARKAPPAA